MSTPRWVKKRKHHDWWYILYLLLFSFIAGLPVALVYVWK